MAFYKCGGGGYNFRIDGTLRYRCTGTPSAQSGSINKTSSANNDQATCNGVFTGGSFTAPWSAIATDPVIIKFTTTATNLHIRLTISRTEEYDMDRSITVSGCSYAVTLANTTTGAAQGLYYVEMDLASISGEVTITALGCSTCTFFSIVAMQY